MGTESQILTGKPERDRRAPSTFSLRDTFSKSIAACPELTHLALALSRSGIGGKALGKFCFFTAGSLALLLPPPLSRDAQEATRVTILDAPHPHHKSLCCPDPPAQDPQLWPHPDTSGWPEGKAAQTGPPKPHMHLEPERTLTLQLRPQLEIRTRHATWAEVTLAATLSLQKEDRCVFREPLHGSRTDPQAGRATGGHCSECWQKGGSKNLNVSKRSSSPSGAGSSKTETQGSLVCSFRQLSMHLAPCRTSGRHPQIDFMGR